MPKQNRLSFIDWMIKYEIAKDKAEAENFIFRWDHYLLQVGLHKGACTNEKEFTCPICSLEGLLEEYSDYSESFFKENIYL